MPVFEETAPLGFVSPTPEPEASKPEPTYGEIWSSAFRLENDVANAIELMQSPTFEKSEQTYDWITKLKSSPYWTDYQENFVGTRNEADYNWRIGQIEEERQYKDTLSRSGFAGTVALIASGALSPTILLPFAGEARGLRGAFQAAKYGLVGGVLQEIPLQANQQTRTYEESLVSIGASTILSGALGGAVMMLRPGEKEAIEQSMNVSPREISIRSQSVGSATSAAEWAGRVDRGPAGAAGRVIDIVDSNAVTRSPVTSTLNGDSRAASFITAQYADAGLSLEGNKLGIPTTPGGTIENAVQRYNWHFEKAVNAIDEQYSKYFFDQKPPKILANTLSSVGGAFSKSHMSKSEFRQEIGKALYSGDVHENQFVQEVAKTIRKEVYDPILKELQSVGLLSDKIKLLADESYLNRVFNTDVIRADRKNAQGKGFREFLTDRFNEKLEADFAKKLEKFNASQAKRKELIEDVQRPQEEIEELRKQFTEQLKALEEGRSPQLAVVEETAATYRAQARQITGDSLADKQAKKDLLGRAKRIEEADVEGLAKLRGDRATLRRRLRNLNKAQVVLEAKHARKLEKIERAEDLSISGLQRVAKKGQKVLNKIDEYSDEELDKELSALRTQFEEVARVYDKGEERIAKLSEDTEGIEGEAKKIFDYGFEKSAAVKEFEATEASQRGLDLEARQEVRADKMTNISEQIADAEDLGRDALRSLIHDALDETITKVQRINSRRAVRTERLRAQAEKLAPEDINARIKAIEDEGNTRLASFNESVRVSGADSFDLATGTADFSRFAGEAADQVVNKILGTFIRLPTVDVMQDLRGATLTRVLDVPSADLAPWLEQDVEKLIRSHIMTMGPDIEIARKFQGTVNMDEILAPMWDEMKAAKEAVKTAVDKKGKPLSDAAQEKRTLEIDAKYLQYKKNLIAIHERLRHNFGLPTDPDGVAYRLGKFVSNMNVLRYMGMVTASSIPDMAQPILKYGLAHVFREAFIPMITNFKAFKMSAREGKYAGVATDSSLNTRPQAVLDIMDNLRRGSKFERGVEYATGKQGLLAGFNMWTDLQKMWTSVSANARLMDSVARVMLKDDKKAGQILAEVGIGPEEAAAIWQEALRVGGAEKHNGVWLPNTESWQQGTGLRAYRAALAREVNRTIVTPGVERPIWTNQTQTGRLLSQFKSFTFASTQRTMMAGLQQRDLRYVQGVTASVALGAMSYYVASLASSDAYEKMIEATPSRWIDEAVARSGMLAVFGLGQDLLSRMPVTAPYSSFSGARTTRRGGDDLLETIAGPTFGDLASRASDIVTGIDDPTQSTVHKFRTLLPGQNLIWLRRLYDEIEAAVPVPERRQ